MSMKRKTKVEVDLDNFTHPVPCTDCGEWFELHSAKSVRPPDCFGQKLVCPDCAEEYEDDEKD